MARFVCCVVLAAGLASCDLPMSGATGTWVLDRVESTDRPYNFKPISNPGAYHGTPSYSATGFSNNLGFTGDAYNPAFSVTVSVSWEAPPSSIKPGTGVGVAYFWNSSSTGTVPTWGSCVGGVTGPSDSTVAAGRLDQSVVSANLSSANQTFRETLYFYGTDEDHEKPEVAITFSVYCGSATSPNDGSFGGETRRYVYKYQP